MRLCSEGDKDFTTIEDDQGKAVLLAILEDKRKRWVIFVHVHTYTAQPVST